MSHDNMKGSVIQLEVLTKLHDSCLKLCCKIQKVFSINVFYEDWAFYLEKIYENGHDELCVIIFFY